MMSGTETVPVTGLEGQNWVVTGPGFVESFAWTESKLRVSGI